MLIILCRFLQGEKIVENNNNNEREMMLCSTVITHLFIYLFIHLWRERGPQIGKKTSRNVISDFSYYYYLNSHGSSPKRQHIFLVNYVYLYAWLLF